MDLERFCSSLPTMPKFSTVVRGMGLLTVPWTSLQREHLKNNRKSKTSEGPFKSKAMEALQSFVKPSGALDNKYTCQFFSYCNQLPSRCLRNKDGYAYLSVFLNWKKAVTNVLISTTENLVFIPEVMFLACLGHGPKEPGELWLVHCHYCHSASLSAYVSSPSGCMANHRDIIYGKYVYLCIILMMHMTY